MIQNDDRPKFCLQKKVKRYQYSLILGIVNISSTTKFPILKKQQFDVLILQNIAKEIIIMKNLAINQHFQQEQIAISFVPTTISYRIYEYKNESAKGCIISIVYFKLSSIKSQSKQLSKFQDGSLNLKYTQTKSQEVEIQTKEIAKNKFLIRNKDCQQEKIAISYFPTTISYSIYEYKKESAKGYIISMVYFKLSCIKSQSKQFSKFQDVSLNLKYIQTQIQEEEIYSRAFYSKNIFRKMIIKVNVKFLLNIFSKKLNLISQFKYQCKETTPGRLNSMPGSVILQGNDSKQVFWVTIQLIPTIPTALVNLIP
ncbi:hypothetical protein ABPG74_009045 [Tetrahymena malaccensis]